MFLGRFTGKRLKIFEKITSSAAHCYKFLKLKYVLGRFTGKEIETSEKITSSVAHCYKFPSKNPYPSLWKSTPPLFLTPPFIRHFFPTPPLWWFLGRLYPLRGEFTLRPKELTYQFSVICICQIRCGKISFFIIHYFPSSRTICHFPATSSENELFQLL